MKRKMLSIAVFAVVFVAAYLVMCFCIGGMRIKLEAEPMVYFVESLRHMAFFKTIVSIVPATIAAVVVLFVKK